MPPTKRTCTSSAVESSSAPTLLTVACRRPPLRSTSIQSFSASSPDCNETLFEYKIVQYSSVTEKCHYRIYVMNLIDFLFVFQQFRIFVWPSQIRSPQNTFQNRKETEKTKENKIYARRSFHTLCHYVVRVKSMIVKYLNFISQGFKISVFIITLANSPKVNKRTTRKNPIDSLGPKHKPYT